ncbi:phosphatase PAP2 family protein [Candidatus Woesearchaeota archaeon]|nr:phosphatase PAP2 family protein [Candidatus Woesearchaeota archaeon]
MASEFAERQKEDFFRDITAFGSLWWYLTIAILFLIYENYGVFINLLTGLVFIYAIAIAIRAFYFKNRPKKYSYNSFIEKIDAASFPSLHSARASFLSIALIYFFDSVIASIFLVIMVFIVAYSRIHLKKHDIKDVSAGVVVGVAVYFIVRYLA